MFTTIYNKNFSMIVFFVLVLAQFGCQINRSNFFKEEVVVANRILKPEFARNNRKFRIENGGLVCNLKRESQKDLNLAVLQLERGMQFYCATEFIAEINHCLSASDSRDFAKRVDLDYFLDLFSNMQMIDIYFETYKRKQDLGVHDVWVKALLPASSYGKLSQKVDCLDFL